MLGSSTARARPVRRSLLLAGLVGLASSCATGCGAPPEGVTDAGPPCASHACPEPDTVCVEDRGVAECVCREGTAPDASGRCVVPSSCAPDTCHGHGECTELDGEARCECEPDFGGPLCERCADGLHDDGVGGCTADLCVPNPCPIERRCEVVDGAATCACPAGMHDEGGECVEDQECTATTCNGHGTCSDDDLRPSCACDEGWAGAFCDRCDEPAGYHDDGAGGCTTDACLPDPCDEPNRGVCVADDLGVRCACDPGFHLEMDACVPDEVCGSDTCSGHGACAVVDGRTECTCDAGYTGAACDACAATHHDDGAGGCTTDACLPNPCTTVANRTICSVDAGGLAVCACEAGYHDDGTGGCTTDPCRPDPCAATGMACRADGGTAECYTPACDDGNPCTDDTYEGGGCVFRPRSDGAACSTTLCVADQACLAGSCVGGTAVSCDDARPCTADSCDALLGCQHTADDTIVPDDGLDCTDDVCSGGVASNTPRDARCDDALFCTGVETCEPTDAAADARGCVVRDVPRPPGPSSTCGTYVCDEPSRTFDLVPTSSGTGCSDGLACTTSDACDGAGACRGAVTGECGSGGACASTTSWGAGDVEIGPARVVGELRYGGSTSFPDAAYYSADVDVFLRAEDTGVYHLLESVNFTGTSSGTGYPVYSANDSDDRIIDLPVMPGVYDVVYVRGPGITSEVSWSHDPDETYAYGHVVLQENVVIGPGTNALNVDVAPARVTGVLRYGGSTTFPDAAYYSADVDVFLRSRDTGVYHLLESVNFTGTSDGVDYPVYSANDSDDRIIDLPVMPGVYDVVYVRGPGITSEVSWSHDPDETYAYGHVVLQTGVTIAPGANTLDVDVAPARVTGELRYGGSTTFPEAAYYSADAHVFLRSVDTGVYHSLERVNFTGTSSGTGYPVYSANDGDDRIIDLPVMPGVYDVVYVRGPGITSEVSWSHDPDETYAYGHVVLREDVTIAPGANTLNVDVAPARVTGELRYGGSTTFPEAAYYSADVDVFLRSVDTGVYHLLESVNFTGTSSGSGYPVYSANDSDDRVIDLPVMPGVYDVVYVRGPGITSEVSWSHDPDETYAYGHVVLQTGVTIAAGANTLNVDVAPARVTGQLRYGGSTTFPEAAYYSADVDVFLRSVDTGVYHLLESVNFTGTSSGSGYPVYSANDSDDRVIDLPVMPGVYDVVYVRGPGVSSEVSWSHDPDETYAYGHVVLQTGVTVGPGGNTLNVDVAPSHVTGRLLHGGSTSFPEAAYYSADVDVFLRSRDTGVYHLLESVNFTGTSSGSGYPVYSANDSDDRVIDLPVMPGEYDLVYVRGPGITSEVSWSHDPDETYAYGHTSLGQCVTVP